MADPDNAFLQEIEDSLSQDEGLGRLSEPPDTSEVLPSQPFRFVLHYLRYYKWALLAMALCELGQAACQILIPKAVQRLIDAASRLTGGETQSVWTALAGPMKFFLVFHPLMLCC